MTGGPLRDEITGLRNRFAILLSRLVDVNHKNRKRIARISHPIGVLPLLGWLAFACTAKAQPVLMEPPQYSVPPPASPMAQNNEMQVFNPAASFLNMLEEINPYQWGPVSFRPSFTYSFSYATGVQSNPGSSSDSIVQTVSPSFLFLLGTHWSLDYTPSWTFYSSSQLQNSLSHSVAVNWGTSYEDWGLGFSQGYTRSDSPTIQTGAQTDQQGISTALNASYQFNTQMSLSMEVSQNINLVSNSGNATNSVGTLANSYSWSTMEWLNYQFWPRLTAGIGAGVGYATQAGSPDSVNEQYQGRVNWRATDKVSFGLNGGVQVQQYLGSGAAGDLITPVFGGSIQYQPIKPTQLTLSANRSVSPSYYQSQSSETTTLTAALNQQFKKNFTLGLTGGYATTSYSATSTGVVAGGNNDTYSFSASLSHPLTKRGTISVNYSYSENSSNNQGLSYSSNQIGVQIGYQF